MNRDLVSDLPEPQRSFFERLLRYTDMADFHKRLIYIMGLDWVCCTQKMEDSEIPFLLVPARGPLQTIEVPEIYGFDITSDLFYAKTLQYMQRQEYRFMKVKLKVLLWLINQSTAYRGRALDAIMSRIGALTRSIGSQRNLLDTKEQETFEILSNRTFPIETVKAMAFNAAKSTSQHLNVETSDRPLVFDAVRQGITSYESTTLHAQPEFGLVNVKNVKLMHMTMLWYEMSLTKRDPARKLFLAQLYERLHNQIVSVSRAPYNRVVTGDPRVRIIELDDINRTTLDMIRS